MEADCQNISIVPAPKATRGYPSSLDVSSLFILYFNSNTVILRPHQNNQPAFAINHTSDIAAAKFSHDGQLLASIDVRGTLIVSEPLKDRIVTMYQYEGVFPNAKSLDWSGDKKKLCVVGQGKNKFAKVISIDTGITVGDITAVTSTLNSCSFRPQRPYKLVLGGDESTVKCYDGPPYSFIKSDQSHTGYIYQIKYSPKGTFFVSGGADRRLVLYDGKSYERLGQKQNAHNGGIFGLDWIDEQHLVSVSSDKLIKIWNVKFEEIFVIQAGAAQDIKNAKKIGLFLVSVRVHKDLIYVNNLEGQILVYKNPLLAKQVSLVQRYAGTRNKIVKILAFDQNNILLLDSSGQVLNYSKQLRQLSVCKNVDLETNTIVTGFIVKSEKYVTLFVLTGNGKVYIFAGESANQLAIKHKVDCCEFRDISMGRHQRQFIGSANGKIILFDISTSIALKQEAVEQEITSVRSNDRFVAVGTIKGKILIFSSQLKLIQKITLKTFKISTLAFIPSKQTKNQICLIGDSCGHMSSISISMEGVNIIKQTMGGHNSVITGVDFDENNLFVFSMDGKITVWNRESFQRLREIKDTVNGGILTGISIDQYLVVSGNDLMTKLIKKTK